MCHPDAHAHPASQLLSYSAVDCRHHVHHTRDGRPTAESNQYAAAIRLPSILDFLGSPCRKLDILIVDEASIIHLKMMSALLQALPTGANLVLLGDKDQLASVEAGAIQSI